MSKSEEFDGLQGQRQVDKDHTSRMEHKCMPSRSKCSHSVDDALPNREQLKNIMQRGRYIGTYPGKARQTLKQ